MIFFLSSLPCDTYNIVSKIFKAHAEGKLKDQVIPISRKGIKSMPDLKGSTFKVFRALDFSVLHRLLKDVMDNNLSIKEATVQCNDIKSIQKIQQGFIRAMNMQSWDEATEIYPQHTTSEALEPFKHLDFSGCNLPQQFLQFCNHVRAIRNRSSPIEEDYDDIFVLKYSTTAIFWKINIMDVTIDSIDLSLKKAREDKCIGFSLAMLDYTHPCELSSDQVCVSNSCKMCNDVLYVHMILYFCLDIARDKAYCQTCARGLL